MEKSVAAAGAAAMLHNCASLHELFSLTEQQLCYDEHSKMCNNSGFQEPRFILRCCAVTKKNLSNDKQHINMIKLYDSNKMEIPVGHIKVIHYFKQKSY